MFAPSSGPNVSLFPPDPICHGPNMKVSYKQICIVFLHLSLESDSVLLSYTNLSCNFYRVVRTALVFVLHPDSLMMSGACLKSGSIPGTVPFDQLQPWIHDSTFRRLFTSESSNPRVPMSVAVYLELRRPLMCLSPSSSDKHTKPSQCTAFSHLDSDCETMRRYVCLFGSLPNSPQISFT